MTNFDLTDEEKEKFNNMNYKTLYKYADLIEAQLFEGIS